MARKRQKKDTPAPAFDAVISGGGMVGLTLGETLAACGLKVAVVDAQKPRAQLQKTFDGRASAIAHASIRMLEAIGIWKHAGDFAQPIEEIRVSDKGSYLFLHFDQEDAGHHPMGHMLENRHIRWALQKRAGELKILTFIAPDKVISYEDTGSGAKVYLESGKTLEAPLLISAEGRKSQLREQAGITMTKWSYPQLGVVATIHHELDHLGIAHEKFFPEGPFAILPLKNNRASLVWTTQKEFAETIMNLSDAAFEAEVRERVGDFLGKVEIRGPRWQYPLSFQLADRYTDDRLVLVGDAAHGIHPIAGQGLNMGFRDIAVLAEVLTLAKKRGEDIGSPQVMDRYTRWRRTDNFMLAAITDSLNCLFSNKNKAVGLVRDAGLGMVQKIPPARRFFVSHARGTFGKLPALLRGALPGA